MLYAKYNLQSEQTFETPCRSMSAVVLHSIALRATLIFEAIIPTFASDHSGLNCRFHGSILSTFSCMS